MEIETDEIRSAFCLFDRQNQGSLAQEDVGTVLRCLGFTPSEAQVKEMLSHHLKVGSGERLKFKAFLEMVREQQPAILEETELLAAFEIFDREQTGYIAAEQLRSIVTNLGELLSNDEVQDMMEHINIDENGDIDYRQFARQLCNIRDCI